MYLNEPETEQSWPGYRSSQPGVRPLLYFDPQTGKLAYPFMRPHLGQRPPSPPITARLPFWIPFTREPRHRSQGKMGWGACARPEPD